MSSDIASLLAEAASFVVPCPDGSPTTEGWATPEGRRDPRTCIQSLTRGLVTISPAGLPSFERAVELLKQEPAIRDAWKASEIGSLLASAVSAAAFSDNVSENIQKWLLLLREVYGSFVVFPVANIAWGESSMSLGDRDGELIAFGDLNESFVKRLCLEAARFLQDPIIRSWAEQLKKRYCGTQMPVLFAARVKTKGERGVDEAMKAFATVIQIAVLFMRHASPGHCSTCAHANRPGPRGFALDRLAIERRLGANASDELSAQVLSLGLPRFWDQSHWNDAAPLPLGQILHTRPIAAAVAQHLYANGPISARIRLAARWFADAYWSADAQDAALSLGISLEALIGSPTPLPGRALAERFSVLETDDASKDGRAKAFRAFWKTRSKMAHGARDAGVDPADVESMKDAVYWAARRLDALEAAFGPKTEDDLERIFGDLISGATTWPSSLEDQQSK